MKFASKYFLIITLLISSFSMARGNALSCDQRAGDTFCEAMDHLASVYAMRCPISESCLPLLQTVIDETIAFNGIFDQVDRQTNFYDVSIARKAINLSKTMCQLQVYGPEKMLETLKSSQESVMNNLTRITLKSGYWVQTCTFNYQ